ncbi:MAG: ZTL protein [Deltaproteobacteria bacterium CG_4_9_14_3_um_filter_63_12]|nr:MAG: ZTL protein [Deltaproteobacteria bacterium CG_4_9_14_3_um_filter_63_12]
MSEAVRGPQILVLAGTNGAGKSSIGGALLRHRHGDYFNPDEATRRIMEGNVGMSLNEANSLAWHEGKRLLEEAIEHRKHFAFETTLGGKTITRLLKKAAEEGMELRIWFAGLDSPETHIERVKLRAEKGGHAIPEDKIRARFDLSRRNLVELIPLAAELSVYDNSFDADPATGTPPRPRLLLRMKDGRIIAPGSGNLEETPKWARPIVMAAMRCHLARKSND